MDFIPITFIAKTSKYNYKISCLVSKQSWYVKRWKISDPEIPPLCESLTKRGWMLLLTSEPKIFSSFDECKQAIKE